MICFVLLEEGDPLVVPTKSVNALLKDGDQSSVVHVLGNDFSLPDFQDESW